MARAYIIRWSCMRFRSYVVLWSYTKFWSCMILWSDMIPWSYIVLWSYVSTSSVQEALPDHLRDLVDARHGVLLAGLALRGLRRDRR